MHKINFSQRAVDDLGNIWNYTAENWSVEQADNYYKIIISCCNTIAENPFLCGKKYNDVKGGLLGCKVKKLIIFYQICNEEVLIIRILHERMDYYKTSQW